MYAAGVKTEANNKSAANANSVTLKESNVREGEEFEDNRPIAVAQRKLRHLINNSPRIQRMARFQEVIRKPSAPPFQRKKRISFKPPAPKFNSSGSSSSHKVIQRVINHDPPAFTPKNNRAGSVLVQNILGTPYGPGANSPSVDIFGWKELYDSGDTLANPHSTHYNAVRMHLWNGRLGGPGGDWRNLAPGPAQINSSMSAGPETDSKDAVSAGSQIWLNTEVWYHGDSGLANDYTSVVPNRMKMAWGYMLGADNKKAGLLNPSTKMGPANPPGWDVSIDQPAGAMTADRKKEYTDLAAMDAAAQPAAVDALLSGTSNQEKAQAYELVSPALKKHLLLNYPIIFAGMDDAARGAALAGLSVAEIQTLIVNLALPDYKVVYNEIMFYLVGANLVGLFQSFSAADQIELIKYSKGDLFAPLGAVAAAIARVNRSIFGMLDSASQYNLLDTMTDAEIAVLLNNAIHVTLFENWAASRGHDTPDKKSAFIKGKVTDAMGKAFKVQMDWVNKQNAPRINPHPSRFHPYSK